MNKLFYLLKIQAMQWLGINKAIHSGDKKEAGKLIGILGFILLVATLCIFSVAAYSMMIAYVLQPMNKMEWLPGTMMAVSSIVIGILSFLKTNGFLFGFQDYDMLMSLPVKTSVVVASRLLQMYGMSVGIAALFMVPSSVVYGIFSAPTWWFYMGILPGILVIPLVPMVVASLLGLVITVTTMHFRYKNLISLLVMILLLLGIMGGSMGMDSVSVDMGAALVAAMEAISRVYPFIPLFIDGTCHGHLGSILLFCGISLVIMVVFCWCLGHWYRSINSRLAAGGSKTRYSLKTLKQGTPFSALCKREWRRYISSPLYVMNTAVGYVLLLAGAVALLFVDTKTVLETMGFLGADVFFPRMVPVVMMLFVGMYTMTACCISLEGNQLWIIKSLPISSKTILQAKLVTSVCIQAPFILLSGILLSVALRFSIWAVLWNTLLPLLYAFWVSVVGLLINLSFPNFTWTSEVTVIKQSPAVMLTILVNMVGAGASLAVAVWASSLALPSLWVLLGLFVFWLIMAVFLYTRLIRKGTVKFTSFA